MTKSENVTGRDGYIVKKALAYAIETIERLPEQWQEWHDKEDMKKILAASVSSNMIDYFTTNAREHIQQRGVDVEGGQLVVRSTDPTQTIVKLRPNEEAGT